MLIFRGALDKNDHWLYSNKEPFYLKANFLPDYSFKKVIDIMRFKFLMAIAGAGCIGFTTPATAAPQIIATKVAAICKILPDGTATTVSVTLHFSTYNFYGQSLFFKFTPTSSNSGTFQNLQHPAGIFNPVVPLAVSPGDYTLQITNQFAPGGSSSAVYNVTVPAGIVLISGSRKFCKVTTMTAPKAWGF